MSSALHDGNTYFEITGDCIDCQVVCTQSSDGEGVCPCCGRLYWVEPDWSISFAHLLEEDSDVSCDVS